MLRVALCALLVAAVASADDSGKTVHERDRPAGAPPDALVAFAMDAGRSPDEHCRHSLDFARKQDPQTANTCGAFAHRARIRVAAPWQSAQLVELVEHSTGNVPITRYVHLFVQVDGRWFSYQLGHTYQTADAHSTLTVRSVAVSDVIRGGKRELVVTLSETEGRETRDSVLFCGFGSSGAPSCVSLRTAERDATSHYRLAWSFDRRGRVLLRAAGKWPKALPRRDYELTRPIYFL